MKELIEELNRKFDLKLGNKSFSPIMQCSIGLALKYKGKVEGGFRESLHLNFPDKQDSALWLSVALMRNFLLEDFIYQPSDRIEDLGINKGDKVEIFGAICTYEGSLRDKVLLGFSDQDSPIYITNKLIPYINPTKRRQINKFQVFGRKKKEARLNRNAISKLLEPKEPILINEKILASKVLVIAGRGDTGRFTQRLKSENLYNTSLYDLFNCGKNLIIKPDLEDFTFLTQKEDSEAEEKFEHYFLEFIDELIEELPDKIEIIDNLISRVKNKDYQNKEFKKAFDNLVSECDQNSKYHKIKNEYYPGFKEKLPEQLKAVVVNDITQLEVYQGVVEEFIRKDIPVLVISNRYIEDKKALSFFENYFKTNSKDLRINWDKKKIQALSEIPFNQESALDHKLWEKCLKFSNQKIAINTTDPHPVDSLFNELQRSVSNLEGQERLWNAYWRYFNPLVYSFKNSIGWNFYHDELLAKFLSVFEDVKVALDQDLSLMFDKVIYELKTNNQSLKFFEKEEIIFGQQIDLDDKSIIFPNGDLKNVTSKKLDSSASSITFPGFPLNEPINNFLIDAISEQIVEDIKIYCWPNEGELTYHYILNRLKAGYFSDNIPKCWMFPNRLLIKGEGDIREELSETLVIDLKNKNEIEKNNIETDEEALRKISTFKYSAYQKSSNSSDSNAKVSCNIIDLEDNQFIFLPKTSTVLAKIETEGEDYDIKNAKFNDLKIGDEIFQYELSRHRLRELSRDADYHENIFTELEKWKSSLKKSFIEEEYNLKKLLKRLKKVNLERDLGASPTYQNLRNWLFDEDMLSPEKQNLQMILYADSDTEIISEFSNIYDAYKKARSLSRTVSSEIKKLIISKLKSLNLWGKSKFEIKVFGSPMEIEFQKIRGLQKADIAVEYQHTRKIIE